MLKLSILNAQGSRVIIVQLVQVKEPVKIYVKQHSSSYKNSSSSSQALDLSALDLCKKVTLNEAMMHQAIEKLGGGEMGLKILMDHVRFWVGQRISSNCCNTTADQQISISDSLKQ
ncbi:unnamed protein product, partial [Sphagnum jensenii]